MFRKHRSPSDGSRSLSATALGLALAVLISVAVFAEDKCTLQVSNGLAFSEFRGYENWQIVSVSHPLVGEGSGETLNVIVANPVMVKAYADGIPGNGKSFPDGAKAAKIQYIPQKSAESPFNVAIPGSLKDVAFMVKDSNRFAGTGGWGYGVFNYDSATERFTPDGTGADCGAACHSIVKAKDYVFTRYQTR